MATEAILKYLTAQNRPFSANDIFMNLHKEYGKTAVQKSLDVLVEKGKVKEKVYGKQKVYSVFQETKLSNEEVTKMLLELDGKINDTSDKLSIVEQELRISETALRTLLSTPTTEKASEEERLLRERVGKLKEKLQIISQNTVAVSKDDFDKTKKTLELNEKTWRKRKTLCMNIINSILENYPKPKKALLEDIGIETDESVGASFL